MKKLSLLALVLSVLACPLLGPGWAAAASTSRLVSYLTYSELGATGSTDAGYLDPAPGQDNTYAASTARLTMTQWTEYVDSQGDWAARGQVRNDGSNTVFFAKVSVDLMSKDTGKLYSNEFTYVNGSTAKTSNGTTTDTAIAPGDTVTFDIRYTDAPASQVKAGSKGVSWSNYSTSALNANISLTSLTAYNFHGEWAAKGQVQNTGKDTGFFTKVRSDMFDASGNFIGDDYVYVNGQQATTSNGTSTDTAVLAGSSASFDLKYTDVSWSSVNSFKTRVNWNEYASAQQTTPEGWSQYLLDQEAQSKYYASLSYGF